MHTNIDQCIDDTLTQNGEMHSIASLLQGRGKPPKTRRKTDGLKPIVYVQFNKQDKGRPKLVMLKALLDSGSSGTLVKRKHAKKFRLQMATSAQQWTTAAGLMTTTRHAKATFTIPELHENHELKWNVHLVE